LAAAVVFQLPHAAPTAAVKDPGDCYRSRRQLPEAIA